MKWFWGFLFWSLAIALQIPFLQADPDNTISQSRGPHTDEGLNTGQVRNWIHHGDFTIKGGDNLVKTPLFGGMLLLPFSLLGTDRWVARLFWMLFALGLASYFLRKRPPIYLALFGLILFSLFPIFHFYHYSLAEIPATLCILAAIQASLDGIEKEKILGPALLSALLMSMAYYLKIQFLYVVPILPLGIGIVCLLAPTEKRSFLLKYAATLTLSLAALLALYYLAWYLPNKTLFDYVMADQTSGRFAAVRQWPNHFYYVCQTHFANQYLWAFSLSFIALFIVGIIRCFSKKDAHYQLGFILIGAWCLIEMHKLPMTYLPTRYLVSSLFAMGILQIWVLGHLLQEVQVKPQIYSLLLILPILLGLKNSYHYTQALKSRAYNMLAVDQYIAKHNSDNRPVMGAWAPSLSWKSGAKTFPIWNNYFNDQAVIQQFNPSILIAEVDEADSNEAFKQKGIDLDAQADSIHYFKAGRWNLKLLWIRK